MRIGRQDVGRPENLSRYLFWHFSARGGDSSLQSQSVDWLFCNWLVRDRRTNENPLAHLSRLNARVDIRRDRRVLDPTDFARLIEVAESGKTVCGICGRDRAMLYLMAGYSGLRASELASLTWESIDFHALRDQ